MKAELIESIARVVHVLQINIRWMSWNLFLAFIPLLLSIWLFRTRKATSWLWWLGFLVFYAFLPNAPYMLTDVIHLINDIRVIQSIWMITLVLIPVYLIVILSAFEAYVLSLINLGHYFHRIGKSKWILSVELITHALNAVGIYLGRFLRFNSWDFVTQPDSLLTSIDDVFAKKPLLIITLTFIVLTVLYWVMKQVSLAFVRRSHNQLGIKNIKAEG
jgi:uncharacterized membrane protein